MRGYFCWSLACVLGLVLANPSVGSFSSESPGPTVRLGAGVLEGMQFGSAKNEVAFLGVPYAAPPVGDLRWKPPQPVSHWNETRKATEFGATCPQLPAGWLPNLPWNEDCLYLNVWATQLSASAKLPVIVYFHGGSNTAGYIQLTPLGPALSRLGVVVVSANYRLDLFGIFCAPSSHGGVRTSFFWKLRSSRPTASAQMGAREYFALRRRSAQDHCHWSVRGCGRYPPAHGLCVGGGSVSAGDMESGDCRGVFNEDIRTPTRYNEISGTGEGAGEG